MPVAVGRPASRPESVGDVVVAPASAVGAAERAILRLTGSGLLAEALRYLPRLEVPEALRAGASAVLAERRVHPVPLQWGGHRLPALLAVFPGPRSATGEDLLELHHPGSRPLGGDLLADALAAGARLAEPGEFTRRAFLHGRLDLLAAEAVGDLVAARSAAAARAAARLVAGGAAGALGRAREALFDALASAEAGLDFEEGDSQDLEPGELAGLLASAAEALEELRRGEEARPGRGDGAFRIVLLGPPNAGKSTLFRRLTGAEALVHEAPGTTRDHREAPWRREAAPGAAPWVLIDGPGLGPGAVDARDAAARALFAETAAAADLGLLCAPADAPEAAAAVVPPPGLPWLRVWTRTDLAPCPAGDAEVALDVPRGVGLRELERAVAVRLARLAEDEAERGAARARHLAALGEAAAAVGRARSLDAAGGPLDLLAEELRSALRALQELAGEVHPEDLLDRVFARFCIGK